MGLPVVLFLCTENAARSQMAEAFLRHHAGDRFQAFSAGLVPTGLHPLTEMVMDEVGIGMSGHHAKSAKQFLAKQAVQHVVFLCDRAEAACPFLWPGETARHSWPFPDPTEGGGDEDEMIERFRAVRDQIEARVIDWLDEPAPDRAPRVRVNE